MNEKPRIKGGDDKGLLNPAKTLKYNKKEIIKSIGKKILEIQERRQKIKVQRVKKEVNGKCVASFPNGRYVARLQVFSPSGTHTLPC